MSYYTATAPVVAPTPATSYTAYISAAAGIIVFGLSPILHKFFPDVPALDITQVQGALGILVSLGIMFHTYGIKAVANYVLTNIVPAILPQLEVVIKNVIQQELGKAQIAGVLSDADVHAVVTARLERAKLANPEAK